MVTRVKIDRKMIVRAALKLLDQAGLEHLTLRRLASELKIQAPTLYWHFKSKEALVDEMATTILEEGVSEMLPTRKSAPPKSWGRAYGHGLRKVLLSHRDGARVVAGSRFTNTVYMETMEAIGRRLIECGLSLRETVVLLSTIYSFAVAFVTEEQAVYPKPGRRCRKYDLGARNTLLHPKRFPLLRQSGKILFDRFDRRYRESLNLILAGGFSRKDKVSR